MKKEKNKKIIKILCAVLLLMSLGMTGYTYAKYVTQEKGNGSADIATWSFRIEKDENEDVKTINTPYFEIEYLDDNNTKHLGKVQDSNELAYMRERFTVLLDREVV